MNLAAVRRKSRVLFMQTEVTVLLPEEIRGEKYPVVWLLHGAGGDHKSFLGSADFEGMMRRHPCLFVMPAGLNSDFGAYEDFGTGYDFPAYFFEELMPFVYDTFPAREEREQNFLVGTSMGGFGAASLGLQSPERFAALGILGASFRERAFLAPYADKDTAAFKRDALADPKAFPTEYGDPAAGIKRKEVNVIAKYPTVRAFLDSPDCMWNRLSEVCESGNLPSLYFACGTEDLFYPAVRRIEKRLEELGMRGKAHFVTPSGVGHDGRFFDAQIGAFLDQYGV